MTQDVGKSRSDVWHVVWWTRGSWPPHDPRGDWSDLARLYERHVPAQDTRISCPIAPQRNQPSSEISVGLSTEECRLLDQWVAELTHGDRVAGDHRALASNFVGDQAHVLIECDSATLHQVVGRLKSRLASLLITHRVYRCNMTHDGTGVWGKGFWWAQVLDAKIIAELSAFVTTLTRPSA